MMSSEANMKSNEINNSARLQQEQPRVVFLPFSESTMTAEKAHRSCWQRQDHPSFASVSNYPVSPQVPSKHQRLLVPFDQRCMSMSVFRNGRWESLTQ